MTEPCWHGVIGPGSLSTFYRAVFGVDPRAAPVASGATGWVFGLRGDVDALSQAALSAGASPHGPGAIASPAGTVLHLFGGDHPSPFPRTGPGSIAWTELNSREVGAELEWLAALGVQHEALPVVGAPYHLLRADDVVIGGCTAAGSTNGWYPWVEVSDADEAAAAVGVHGGTLSGEVRDLDGVGRMVGAQDPAGSSFGILQR